MSAQPLPQRSRRVLEIQPMTEEMLQQERDYRSVLSNPQKLRQYAGQIVAVYHEAVWGVGRDHVAVLATAAIAIEQAAGKPDVPSVDDLTIVVVPDFFSGLTPAPAE